MFPRTKSNSKSTILLTSKNTFWKKVKISGLYPGTLELLREKLKAVIFFQLWMKTNFNSFLILFKKWLLNHCTPREENFKNRLFCRIRKVSNYTSYLNRLWPNRKPSTPWINYWNAWKKKRIDYSSVIQLLFKRKKRRTYAVRIFRFRCLHSYRNQLQIFVENFNRIRVWFFISFWFPSKWY